MAIENCPSSWDSRKRRRIGNPPPNPMMIGELGDDILVEILIRLPNLRSASRCKPVCKRWRSLISSPRFNHRFVSHHHQLCIKQSPMPDNPDELQSILVSFLPPMPSALADTFKVWDCFKDLVLCGFWDVGSENKEPGRSYLVCNPFTKQWVALPVAPEKPMGYESLHTRFVFEPRISYDLDLGEEGDDQQKIVYLEYRFRVVCMYQHDKSTKLDLFCSESGKWTKEPLVLPGKTKLKRNLTSCNGELFWVYCKTEDLDAFRYIPMVAAFNPFRPDVPPTTIDAFSTFELPWHISASQGALHLIKYGRNDDERVVWRLQEDRKSLSKQYEVLLKTSRNGEFAREHCCIPSLHPYKPEIIFFHYFGDVSGKRAILSLDLRTGELEKFAEFVKGAPLVTVFHPTLSHLPTPIPRYEELRGMYDGSYNFWVQSSSTTTIPSMTVAGPTKEGVQPVERGEEIRNWRKDNGSAPNPWRRVKKQKVMNGSCSKQYHAVRRKLSMK